MYYVKDNVWTSEEVEEMRALKKTASQLLVKKKSNKFLSFLKKLISKK